MASPDVKLIPVLVKISSWKWS